MTDDLSSQVTYRALMKRLGCIRVPMLQRDYAQGRTDQSDVRGEFLAALEHALKRESDDPELPLNLDFIYGSIEQGFKGTRFSPLDGQQRLTTLFLLHWFLAWQDGAWTQFGEIFRDEDGHSRFSYQVRQSSNEFFDKLVVFEPRARPQDIHSLTAFITDQPWYFRNWRLDPTVQSALTMLDAMHERFKESAGLFARLTSNDRPAITFQLLLLENFGLSDDLYIKMNARGKPLTAFENFKARYEHLLATQFKDRPRKIGEHNFSTAEFVAHRMDTVWADFFWPHRDQANLCDDVMMNLFRVLALVTLDPESKTYLIDAALLRDEAKLASSSDFLSRNWLQQDFTETLIALLDAWSANSQGHSKFRRLLPDGRYLDEVALFEKIRRGSASLTWTEVAQFAAYVFFIREHPSSVQTDSFQDWMRVVRNLAVNTPIERADQLRSAAQGLRELLPNAPAILPQLAALPKGDRIQGFYQPQVWEERIKSGLIINHDGWRFLIDRAEQHGYFRGQIDFLCEFSGATAKRETTLGFRWSEVDHRDLQQKFADYLAKAEAMFGPLGLSDDKHHRWQRALLVKGDYLLPTGSNYSLLVDAPTDPASWKRLLRTSAYDHSEERNKRLFVKALWDCLVVGPPWNKQLDAIIDGASDLPAWREALVRTPSAISYCGRCATRWKSENDIVLLSKSTMRGDHVELFTFCLHEALESPLTRLIIEPLRVYRYAAQNDSLATPHLMLSLNKGNFPCFLIFAVRDAFQVQISASVFETFPSLKQLLIGQAEFVASDGETHLVKRIPRAKILESLAELGRLLSALPTKPAQP